MVKENCMKKIVLCAVMISMVSFLTFGEGNREYVNRDYGNTSVRGGWMVDSLADTEKSSLSAEEIDGILFMREEEKLARDVYTKLYEIHGLPVFKNIGMSEQTHMDALGELIEKYGLADPIAGQAAGSYRDPELQELYHSLMEQGSSSLAGALAVGALIEDLDIKDLLEEIEVSDNEDVKVVYQNLLKGSRNHLRSFYMQLGRIDEGYEPQYISSDYFDRIIDSPRERGGIITD